MATVVFPAPQPTPPQSQPGSFSKQQDGKLDSNSPWVAWFLNQADLRPPEPIPSLPEAWEEDIDTWNQDPTHYEAAQSLLVRQRMNGPNFRSPSEQKRNIFRTKKQKESVENTKNWTFTPYEVARAFDSLLSQDVFEPVGVAQAVLLHARSSSLNELWCYFSDPSAEKQWQVGQWKRRSVLDIESLDSPNLIWLDKIMNSGNIDYVQLLCKSITSQAALDKALGIALSRNWIEAITLLLRSGATASSFQESIQEHIRNKNTTLIILLLSAPRCMTNAAWSECLAQKSISSESWPAISPEILLLCLANRRELASEALLLQSLEAHSLEATAIVFAYAGPGLNYTNARTAAFEHACDVEDEERKTKFFILFNYVGMLSDCVILRQQLYNSVRAGNALLAKTLSDSGVEVDSEPHNALRCAVSQLDFTMIDLLRDGVLDGPVSRVLEYLPDEAPEPDMIRFMNIFGPKAVSGDHLDARLVRAVRDNHIQLIRLLLRYGASAEFNQGAALRASVEVGELDSFNILLERKYFPRLLSKVVPEAMKVTPSDKRLRVMQALLDKGVLAQNLAGPLHTLVSEPEELDWALIQLLIEKKAPVEMSRDGTGSPVSVAASTANMKLLEMLCETRPQPHVLAAAVPVAFGTIEASGYDTAKDMMALLLGTGATGPSVDWTLLEAVRTGHLGMVDILLEHGANANHADGILFNAAVKAQKFDILELLCSKCPPSRVVLMSIIITAIVPEWYELRTLTLLLNSSKSSSAVVNVMWVTENMEEKMDAHPHLSEILSLFLQHQLYVNVAKGLLLRLVVQSNDIALLDRLLDSSLTMASLSTAFDQSSIVKSRAVKLDIWKKLLEKAETAEIGQSKALLQETLFALNSDNNGLKLLLDHKATINHDDGVALEAAARGGSTEIVELLLSAEVEPPTIGKALVAVSYSSAKLEDKISIVKLLMSKEVEVPEESLQTSLSSALGAYPADSQLSELLISHGAKVDSTVFRSALIFSSEPVFKMLVSTIAEPEIVNEAFKLARNTKMDAARRYWVYDCILRQGDVNSEKLSEALVDSIRTDPKSLDIPKLVLSHGATANHRHGMAFKVAAQSSNGSLIKLLSQYLINGVDDGTANLTFELVVRDVTIKGDVRLAIYSSLLQCNISQSSMYKALNQALKRKCPDPEIIYLLLDNGVDPNEHNASCFQLASKLENDRVFRALSKKADLSVVLPKIMATTSDGEEAARLFRICLEEQKSKTDLNMHELILESVRKFPDHPELLGLLFEFSESTLTPAECTISAEWGPEQCPFSIWALTSQSGISNDVLVRLIEQEGLDAATYRTPLSNIPAIFLCLLDESRAPVAEAMINTARKDGFNLLDTTITGSALKKLAPFVLDPKDEELMPPFDEEEEIMPRLAALYLANFSAYKVMEDGSSANDGTLHLAALLALPDFVGWLLNWHDANEAAEGYGSMVPLALACSAESDPWFEAATGDSQWRTRLRETMKLLIPKTNSSWRHRERLVLHIAMENGCDTTEALLQAMEDTLPPKARGKTNHLYTDKAGKQYSPVEYVQTFVEAEDGDLLKLRNCLGGHGLG